MVVVVNWTFASDIGGSGFVKMMPPLPALESSEMLTIFVAATLAKTLEPHARLNGDA